MKRLAVALALVLPMLVMTAPSALAAKPTIQRERTDATVVDLSCGFPVQIHATGVVVTIEWVDADGTTHQIVAFPQGKDTLTNLDTGKSITINVSGPGQFTNGADGSFTLVGTGLWSWDSHPVTEDPGLFLTAGRFVFSIDAAGNQSFQIVGQITDLCRQLAA